MRPSRRDIGLQDRTPAALNPRSGRRVDLAEAGR